MRVAAGANAGSELGDESVIRTILLWSTRKTFFRPRQGASWRRGMAWQLACSVDRCPLARLVRPPVRPSVRPLVLPFRSMRAQTTRETCRSAVSQSVSQCGNEDAHHGEGEEESSYFGVGFSFPLSSSLLCSAAAVTRVSVCVCRLLLLRSYGNSPNGNKLSKNDQIAVQGGRGPSPRPWSFRVVGENAFERLNYLPS